MTSQPNALVQTADYQFDVLEEARNYRRAQMRDFEPYLRGKVLEVGAGIGQMTAELRRMPKIQRLLSIEPDAGYCARLRARFPQHNLLQGTVSDLQPETDWNAIVSIN